MQAGSAAADGVSGGRAILAAEDAPGAQPNCMGDFIAAASLYALAAFTETDGAMDPEVLRVADVTVQKAGASPATNCLRRQAELMIAPYLTCGSFSFRRV